jgi:photosystem II stability/assembly factor-like uncharacterized protein
LPGLVAIVLTGISALKGGSATPVAAPTAIRHVTSAGSATPVTPPIAAGGRWVPTNLKVETDAIIRDPNDASRMVAGTAQGIWMSSDEGKTWQRQLGAVMPGDVLALAAGGSPVALYAADGAGRIFERDGSGTWKAIGPQPTPSSIFSLAVSDTPTPLILAGTAGDLYRGEQVAGKWRWTIVAKTDQSSFASIVWLPGNGKNALATIFGSTPPVLASTDGGLTWQAESQGLPSQLPSVALIVANPQQATVVLSTMGEGVWQLAAKTWTQISKGLPQDHAMPLTRSASGGPLYAGTMGFGVFIQEANGVWKSFGSGLTGPSYIIVSLAYVNGAQPTLVAGTGNGVYRYIASK